MMYRKRVIFFAYGGTTKTEGRSEKIEKAKEATSNVNENPFFFF